MAASAARAAGAAAPISLRGFTRAYGDNVVIDQLSLEIESGEFVVLVGRSGCGKTTLLRALAGLDDVGEQQVRVPASRAVVYQDARLLPWRRVWRNVALGLRGEHIAERAQRALREVGLGHRLDAWPLTLSGGEAQRVALARALVREPQLLLLDEPFAALDALTRIKMHELVLELWQVHHPAVVLVTHDVHEAVALGGRVLVLERGRIAAEVRVDAQRRTDPVYTQALEARLLRQLGVVPQGEPASGAAPASGVAPGELIERAPYQPRVESQS
jgi:sulfonate transport system ATP-binding protein